MSNEHSVSIVNKLQLKPGSSNYPNRKINNLQISGISTNSKLENWKNSIKNNGNFSRRNSEKNDILGDQYISNMTTLNTMNSLGDLGNVNKNFKPILSSARSHENIISIHSNGLNDNVRKNNEISIKRKSIPPNLATKLQNAFYNGVPEESIGIHNPIKSEDHSPHASNISHALNPSHPPQLTQELASNTKNKNIDTTRYHKDKKYKPMKLKNEGLPGKELSHLQNGSNSARRQSTSASTSSTHDSGNIVSNQEYDAQLKNNSNITNNINNTNNPNGNHIIHRVKIEGISKSKLGNDYEYVAIPKNESMDQLYSYSDDYNENDIVENENQLNDMNKFSSRKRKIITDNSNKGNSENFEGVSGISLLQDPASYNLNLSELKSKYKYEKSKIKKYTIPSSRVNHERYLVSEKVLDKELDRTIESFYNIISETMTTSHGFQSKKLRRLDIKLKSLLSTYAEVKEESNEWRRNHYEKMNNMKYSIKQHYNSIKEMKKNLNLLKEDSQEMFDSFLQGVKSTNEIILSAFNGKLEIDKVPMSIFDKVETDRLKTKQTKKVNNNPLYQQSLTHRSPSKNLDYNLKFKKKKDSTDNQREASIDMWTPKTERSSSFRRWSPQVNI